jgi:hypothetical protein
MARGETRVTAETVLCFTAEFLLYLSSQSCLHHEDLQEAPIWRVAEFVPQATSTIVPT